MYLGRDPIARRNRPARSLSLPPEGAQKLAAALRENLLKDHKRFRANVGIAGLPGIDLEWMAAGQTAGVAVWSRNREAGAASLLLCGIDDARERGDALAAAASLRMPVPPDMNTRLDRYARPVLVNVYYSLAYLIDPVVATLSPMLARVFFDTLGVETDVSDIDEPS
jgi:hypothetical protein